MVKVSTLAVSLAKEWDDVMLDDDVGRMRGYGDKTQNVAPRKHLRRTCEDCDACVNTCGMLMLLRV